MTHDEDTDLKALFSTYRPTLADSGEFLRRLTEKAATLEEIRAYHMQLRRNNRRALLAAAAAGFVTGILFTLLLPWLTGICSDAVNWLSTLASTAPMPSLPVVLAWCVVAGMVILISLTTYSYTFRPVTDHLPKSPKNR